MAGETIDDLKALSEIIDGWIMQISASGRPGAAAVVADLQATNEALTLAIDMGSKPEDYERAWTLITTELQRFSDWLDLDKFVAMPSPSSKLH